MAKAKVLAIALVAFFTVCSLTAAGAATVRAPTAVPKAKLASAVITDFGVAVKLTLGRPLERSAAGRAVNGAGLLLALEHEDGSTAGVLLRDSTRQRKTQPAGRTGKPIAALTTGRKAWFFVADARVARIAVAGIAELPAQGSARASIESAANLIADVAGAFRLPGDVGTPPGALITSYATVNQAKKCDEVQRQIKMGEEVLREVPRNPYPVISSERTHWQTNVAALKRWLAKARGYLSANCQEAPGSGGAPGDPGTPGPSGTPGGGGEPANKAPEIFETDLPETGKAGKAFEADGVAVDADGQVSSWTWNWGDGTTTTGTGAALQTSHTYSAPGVYNVTLTVTDDKGAGAVSDAETILVGGAGSKRSDELVDFEILCPDAAHTPGELELSVKIPSYAEDPTFELEPDPICPDAVAFIQAERVNGNQDGELDEWKNPKDTYVVKIKLVHTGPGAGGQVSLPVAIVSWK